MFLSRIMTPALQLTHFAALYSGVDITRRDLISPCIRILLYVHLTILFYITRVGRNQI